MAVTTPVYSLSPPITSTASPTCMDPIVPVYVAPRALEEGAPAPTPAPIPTPAP
eukprot:CAMPEP_0173240078 /NCGR_PEP_ID=MMETSP1142-20121109/13567_1 /TAXON_ID=483371 /ORGANISM="non described non described, Strain CCMP2298" /LENGTH=53 /DNA_ID=CAMNT_0014171161 /DNA_START=340 /DNA_END=498 /DNA_ORIENTATION=+